MSQYNRSAHGADTMINGNYTEFSVEPCQSEIRADITVTEFSTIRVWGQVKNDCGHPVPNVMLKLVKVIRDSGGGCRLQGLAHTISDCSGFYQFDVCAKDLGACYRVLAGKSAIGPERVLPSPGRSFCRPGPVCEPVCRCRQCCQCDSCGDGCHGDHACGNGGGHGYPEPCGVMF